jgi:ankyrin repeat protein
MNIFNDYFIECVKENDINYVKRIMSAPGFDIEYDNNKAIMIACSYGYYDMLKLLIKHKAPINIYDGHLLILAIMSKNCDCVKLLLDNGIIIKKYNFLFSNIFSNLKMFQTVIPFINLERYLPQIIEISQYKNNYRMLVEIINRKYNYSKYNNSNSIIIAKDYINKMNIIYNKLLLKINKSLYNVININIISFIF